MTTLRISILLNCALLGCLALLLVRGQHARDPNPPAAAPGKQPLLNETAVSAQSNVDVKLFQWSELESSDYPTYIANLRRVGCPEQTIRDLITADVDSLYAPRRQPLESKLTSVVSTGRFAVEQELHALRGEEASVIATLLGGAAEATTSAVVAEAPPSRPLRQPPIAMPLVFQEVDLSELNLGVGQRRAINDLRDRFIEELGGADQDPNDPAYRERWQKLQPEIDQDLQGMIGVAAWQDYQLAVRAKAEEQTPPGP
jgi:hypothetical protein